MSKTNFPSSELQIRPASFNDIPYIQHIAYKTWPAAYLEILGDKQLKYMLNRFYSTESLTRQMQEHHHFLLALHKYLPVGFASFSHEEGVTYKLQKLYVLPETQNAGTGKKLLETVKTIITSRNGQILLLNVNRNNNARFFYENAGFTVLREEDIDIGNGYFMNDYVMSLNLSPAGSTGEEGRA